MAAAKIKKGDRVIVLSGKDKGKTGDSHHGVAQGRQGHRVGRQRRHAPHASRARATPQGGLKRSEAPMHISKVAHVTADGKPTRVRFETQDGKKVRVAVKTGEKISG